MRITSRGQVTIPREIRERFNLLPNTEVEFVVRRNTIQLVKADRPKLPRRGELIVRRLRGTGTVRMTTNEIMALTRGE